ncbi:MAG TPA: hypothetical protein VG317_10540 [Pseudonocardiaceae bacterium]|jgi:hypothetical protein|nr:hypothetical protein [Pseudonocardiaceae bacterium]
MVSARRAFQRRIGESRLRRRLRGELTVLGIEGPTTMADVCARLSRRRNKPIRLLAYPLEVPGPFGLWLNTPSADYILYQVETTRLHQEHIIAHELGHLLAGHHSSDEQDDAVWRELMPDIPPELIRRALRRTSYDTDDEREAETVATILLEAAVVAESVARPSRSPRARRAQRALGDASDWL